MKRLFKNFLSYFKKEEWHIEPCGIRTVHPDIHALEMGDDYPAYIQKILIELHQKLH